ncbi:hypothetical protein AADZ91_11745 [Colwelliaceae bacterium 6441]
MQHLLMTKILLSVTSALAFIGVIALTAPNVHADSQYQPSHDNQVIVFASENNEEKRFVVNGKSFNWSELTPEQKTRVTTIEDKIATIESKFKTQEKQLNFFAKTLDEKAKMIEDEVSKFEQVTAKLEQKNINMANLHRLADELAQLSSINNQMMKMKALEIQQNEKAMMQVDLSLISQIETHANELEQVLVEIAESI